MLILPTILTIIVFVTSLLAVWIVSHFVHKRPKSSSNHVFTGEERQQSSTVRALKKEIEELQKILDLKDKRIGDMSKDLETFYEQKDQNKMWNLAEKLFFPSGTNNIIPATNPIKSESGAILQQTNVELSDGDINNMLSNFGVENIKKLLSLGDDKAIQLLKSKQPNLSDSTIKRGIEIAKMMV